MRESVRINIGCGQSPTPGWKNYDNSWSVRLARNPVLAWVGSLFGLIAHNHRGFIDFCRSSNIEWADAVRRIPHAEGTVDVIYTSHMVEHLDPAEAARFLKEAHRVLRGAGIIRIAVPNIKFHIDNYLADGDADKFIQRIYVTSQRPRGIRQMLIYLLVGNRNHRWMYDGVSLCRFVKNSGFCDVKVMEPGTTMIPDSGQLDLRERVPESVFVEGRKL
jgi:predicted SAM-dependent methyltransferase